MRKSTLLRKRFLVAFGVVALALWAALAWMLYQARAQAIESAAAATRNLARSIAEYEDSSVRAIDLSLRVLRDQWVREPASFGAAVVKLDEYLEKEKVIQVAVLDGNADLRFSKLPGAAPENFADREYFRVQKASGGDQLYVSAPVFGRLTKRWAIQFSRPIHDRAGRFAGLVVVAIPPPALEQVYKDISLGAGSVITLARADGQILARSGAGYAAAASVAGSKGLDTGDAPGGDFRAVSKLDGVERFYSYRKLQSYPLTVFVGQDVSTALAAYYAHRTFLLVAGLLATGLLFALGRLVVLRAIERRLVLEDREELLLELHDGSIQSIYAIGLSLETCRRLLERDPARAARLLAEAEANLNLVIQDLRAFIAGDTPGVFDAREFTAEIERSIPRLGERGPAFSVQIDPAAVGKLSGEQAAHVQRIAREAVSNIVRHANATRARVSLSMSEGNIRLDVSDDGGGFGEPARPGLGLGLHHIKARARKLGGEARVVSALREGTRIAVEFPPGARA